MKIKFLLFSILMLLCFSCYSQVMVKFTNASKENFKVLKVMLHARDTIIKNLESGKSTKEIKLPGMFRYCRAQVITEKDTVSFIPIDFVGETYHKSGKLDLKLIIVTDEEGKRYLEFED